jgi:hypothetical protein
MGMRMAHRQLTHRLGATPLTIVRTKRDVPKLPRLTQFHQQVSIFIDSNVIGSTVVVSHLCG